MLKKVQPTTLFDWYFVLFILDQNVWTFFYNNETKKYQNIPHLTFSKDAFLQFCDITKYPKNMHVTAIGQVSLKDPTCLVFYEYAHINNERDAHKT